MKYKKIEKSSYNLHLIKTDRFKTICFRICFRNEIKKDEIMLRNMLTTFMTYSTDTYRTKRDLALKTQDLYAASVYSKSYRSGKYDIINFYLSFLDEKYTEKGMLEESIKLLSDVIFNPNFNDKEKYTEIYNFIYEAASQKIKGIKENSTNYSMMRMLEEMGKDEVYSYRDIGYIEDLKKINLSKMKEYHNKILNSGLIDIYVIGNVDDKIIKLIDKYFVFNSKKTKLKPIITHKKLPSRIKTVKEKDNSSQSKLSIGCKIGKLSEYERNYVITLYNMLLGGNSESKFFQVIREKHSLCYYIGSSLNKLDSLLLIRAGINKDNFNKTVKLIKGLMKEMEDGKFSEEDIKTAKESYISLLNEIEDNPEAIVETYLAKDLLNLGDIEERKKEIKKVSKKDIIKVAKKVKIDTIFLLEGVAE